MARMTDRDRVLLLLSDATGLSNLRVRTELNLSDERYRTVATVLVRAGLAEKYKCRGGGIRLTAKGENSVPKYPSSCDSSVAKEADLYSPLVSFLRKQGAEDGSRVVVCDTSALRARGQWQNPDVTKISVERYARLRRKQVFATTYEVKQFPNWNVGVVYEAASHHRFSHEAHVVLEWPNGLEFSLTAPSLKMDQIARECQRYGVGLATLHPYYASYRLRQRLDPVPTDPNDEDVEAWLDYMLTRSPAAEEEFERLMDGNLPAEV